jgi:phenylpropionate dioxygenase-like ring-hydroxylating dioxygenase large terminal subunit
MLGGAEGHLQDSFWARTFENAEAFDREQAKLGSFWTLLGVTTDLSHDGDWFRATLGARSVFVQRFGDDLVGFENVCRHRFYPLRTTDKGNGPIRCGFHHWQYNKEGVAIGIPKCQEMFGVAPRELNARLQTIEIATCGILVFGRFSAAENTETLEQCLGDAFPIISAMWNLKHAPYYIETPIAANWKLCYHITLDDYHIVAVNRDTFGKGGYLPLDAVRYHRLGLHSAYFYGGEDNEVARMAEQCRSGTYRPLNYRIFQLFPNMLTLHFEAERNWYVLIQQYVPLGPGRSLSRSWYGPAPFPPVDKNWVDGIYRRVVAPFVPYVVPFYIRKIFHEDNSICEGIQSVARQIHAFPILGRHEERVAWFEDVYAQVFAEAPASKQGSRPALIR